MRMKNLTFSNVSRLTMRRAVSIFATVLFLGSLASLTNPAVSTALPPDGAGPDTPGTSASVWPREITPGQPLNFSVSGYPPNEVVYIKIDDGESCTDTSHGACVYHQQRLDGNGSATGSFIVPNLPAGHHWLRLLASADVIDKRTGQTKGYVGYTKSGGTDFTVVSGGNNAGAPAPAASSAAPSAGQPAQSGYQQQATGGGVYYVPAQAGQPGVESAPGQPVTPGQALPAPGQNTAQLTVPGAAQPQTNLDSATKNVSSDLAAREAAGKSAPATANDAVETKDTASQNDNTLLGIIVLGASIIIGAAIIAFAVLRRKGS